MVGKEKKKKLLLLLFGLIKRKEKNCDYVKEPILPLKSTTEWHRSAMMGHGGGACIWETATTTTGIVMVAMAWALGSTMPVERYRYEEREPQQRWHVRCIAEEVRSVYIHIGLCYTLNRLCKLCKSIIDVKNRFIPFFNLYSHISEKIFSHSPFHSFPCLSLSFLNKSV